MSTFEMTLQLKAVLTEKRVNQVACRLNVQCVQVHLCVCVFCILICWCNCDLCMLLSSYLRALATEEYAMWISSSIGQVEANSSRAYAAFRYLQRFVKDWGMLKFRYFKHTTWRGKAKSVWEHNQRVMLNTHAFRFTLKSCSQSCIKFIHRLHSLKQKITFTMWSLGSRLQSARVSSWPSRNGRDEEMTSSELFSSISSGSGEPR